jgi:predicted GNAT family N-acyltransferase
MVHPFDVLEAFPGFRTQFKALMTDKIEVGEIGRVAVDAAHRGGSISEAVVDTAVSLAQRHGVGCIFLACHEAISPLYAKCLFRPVEGLRADTFLNIALPSIVMKRTL